MCNVKLTLTFSFILCLMSIDRLNLSGYRRNFLMKLIILNYSNISSNPE